MLSEQQILTQIKFGDIVAFKELFDAVYLELYFYCRKYISDSEQIKDLLQNVFLRFWEKRAEIEIHTSLKAYLYRSAHNECINYLRSVSQMDCSDFSSAYENRYSEETVQSNLQILDMESIIHQTIEELPPQCQHIFRLSRQEGLKNQEIADLLNLSVRTIDTQIYRALKILKSRLRDYIYD